MSMKNYVQSDTLKDLIDWEAIMPMARCAGGHDDQMKGLFKGATVLAHWNEGGYQGDVATLVELPDGRAVAYSDYYGSCSWSDCWEDANDDDVRKLCIDLANGAYVWPNKEDALAWLEWASNNNDNVVGYQWRRTTRQLLAEMQKQK